MVKALLAIYAAILIDQHISHRQFIKRMDAWVAADTVHCDTTEVTHWQQSE